MSARKKKREDRPAGALPLLDAVDKLGAIDGYCNDIEEFIFNLYENGHTDPNLTAIECVLDRVRARVKDAKSLVDGVRLSRRNSQAEETAARR